MTELGPDPAIRPDLDSEEEIERLVRSFYRQAAVDDVLGPVFEAAAVDWTDHIPRVTSFWAWQLIGGRRYDGRPLRSHQRVNTLVPFTEAHYQRWLELFVETLHEGWEGPLATLAERRAHRMAASMRRVLGGDDDPDPTWPDEGAGPAVGEPEPSVPVPDATAGGVVMRVAVGRTADRRRGGAAGPAPG